MHIEASTGLHGSKLVSIIRPIVFEILLEDHLDNLAKGKFTIVSRLLSWNSKHFIIGDFDDPDLSWLQLHSGRFS